MATDASRRNVGAYVLGILDPDEMTAFEAHLADCDTCAAEVEALLPTALAMGDMSANQAIALHMIQDAELPDPDLLDPPAPQRIRRRPVPGSDAGTPGSRVGGGAPAGSASLAAAGAGAGPAGGPGGAGPRLGPTLGASLSRRLRTGPGPSRASPRPRQSGPSELLRRTLARTSALHRKPPAQPRHGQATPTRPGRRFGVLGGAGVAVAMLLAFVVGAKVGGGSDPIAQGAITPPVASAPAGLTASASDGVHGRQFDVTDPATGVHAVMSVADASWGSQISLILGGVHGPLRCDLVAIGLDGVSTVVASWSVHAPGYGIPEEPEPLLLQAATARTLAETREFRIRALRSDGGAPSVLVTLTV
jgi:putative zinc finger protein